MTVISPPSYLQFGAHSASSDRLTVASLLQPGATPLSTRGGVRPSGDGNSLKVTAQATPTNSVQIAAGSVFVPESDGQGVYVAHNDAPVTRTIAAASTTQNRRDLVVMQVSDQEVSGSTNTADIVVITGTAVSGTATAPSVPANAYALAEVSVPAGSTTNIANSAITDRRATAIAIGGLLPATSSSLPANPYDKMAIYCGDDDTVRVWSASAGAWRVLSMYPLPDPVTTGPNNQTQTITSTTWANFPTRQFIDITAARPMWVLLHLSAWMGAVASTDSRASIGLTGATTGVGPNGVILNTTSNSYGDVLFATAGQYNQSGITVPYKLNSGTTRVEAMAYRSNASGTPQVNYARLGVTPLRYA